MDSKDSLDFESRLGQSFLDFQPLLGQHLIDAFFKGHQFPQALKVQGVAG